MTEAMPFLQKFDITFLRPPTICGGLSSLDIFKMTPLDHGALPKVSV